MRSFLSRLLGLAMLLGLAALTGCAGGPDLVAVLGTPADSSVQQLAARQLRTGKVKFKGPVTIQVGAGNTHVAATRARAPVAAGGSQAHDYTRAGQHGGALATAPGARTDAATRRGVPPWLLGVGAGLLGLAGAAYGYCRLAVRKPFSGAGVPSPLQTLLGKPKIR